LAHRAVLSVYPLSVRDSTMALQVYSAGAWSVEQRIELGPGCEAQLAGKIPIIEKSKADSVNAAVSKLNAKGAAPQGGMCIVHSNMAQKYFLLYQAGKEQSALEAAASVGPKAFAQWSVEQRVDLGPLDAVKAFVANNPNVQIIDKAKCNSVNAAVSKLNAEHAASKTGMCIVYSNAAQQHFLLYQAGKEHSASKVTHAPSGDGSWSVEQRIDLGPLDSVKNFVANNPNIDIIAKAKCDSVNTAVSKLNTDSSANKSGMCVVYSKAGAQHFLLYHAGMKQSALALC